MANPTSTATTLAPAVVAIALLLTAMGCRERNAAGTGIPAMVATGFVEATAACAGDSLRPSVAAPAQGLWLFEGPVSKQRVAAMIGPPNAGSQTLTMTRSVETVEVDTLGDTVRTRTGAASVTLELLPVSGSTPSGDGQTDSTSSQPAATYVLSPRVRLAAYEPCATSARLPVVRYVRRDASGRIVTDVMLRRASGER